MNPVVIYARYSSSAQNEQSIEGQLRECYKYAEQNGYTVVCEYIDRALSGRSDDRPEFLRMIEDAKKGQFEFVIVYKLDRFARNRYDSAFYKHKLKQCGVKVLSATEAIGDNPESIILEAVLEASAEYYSHDLSQKVTRGMRESALKGNSTGSPAPLGYKHVDKKVVIDENKAHIVRYVFEEYATGTSIVELIDTLNAKGYTTKQGKPFNKDSFKRVLQNEKYIGIWRYTDIVNENSVPPLISRELFERVQQRAKASKHAAKGRRKGSGKPIYHLTGKLFCAYCGAHMTAESGYSSTGEMHNYYSCSRRKRYKNCDKAIEKKDFLEWYIAEQAVEAVLTPHRMKYIAESVAKQYANEFGHFRINELEKQINRVNREIDKCVDTLLDTPKSAQKRINARIEELEAQENDLSTDLAKLKIATNIRLTSDDVMIWLKSFVGGDLMDAEYRRKIIDSFVNAIYLYDDQIIIYYNIKDSKQVSYIGMLEDAGAISIGNGDSPETKKLPSTGESVRQLGDMVTRRRFERRTL